MATLMRLILGPGFVTDSEPLHCLTFGNPLLVKVQFPDLCSTGP